MASFSSRCLFGLFPDMPSCVSLGQKVAMSDIHSGALAVLALAAPDLTRAAPRSHAI
jgi:hypothetical protein